MLMLLLVVVVVVVVVEVCVKTLPAVLCLSASAAGGTGSRTGLDEDFRYLERLGLTPIWRRFGVFCQLLVNVCRAQQ